MRKYLLDALFDIIIIQMFTKFTITLCNPTDHNQEYELDFKLWDSEHVELWKHKILQAQSANYPIDDPQRFYGLSSIEHEKQMALYKINSCIDTINSHQPLIDRHLDDIHDTDTLNYLHHIFELHHGLLDQQTSEFWKTATPVHRKALADLNIAVHKVENVLYGNKARFTVTYYGLPKQDKLKPDDFKYMTHMYQFGGLYLNYVEIGKTVEDLMRDNDQYIEPEAFQPWKFYSADFTVKLYDVDTLTGMKHDIDCKNYYETHKDFFKSVGYETYTNKLYPGCISIGQMIYQNKEETLESIRQHQYIKSVKFSLC
jgi:hypothetical protein